MSAEQGENGFLKLVGIKEFYNITRAKVISAVNCCVLVSLCATATFAVDSALSSNVVAAVPVETVTETSADIQDPDVTETTIEVTIYVIESSSDVTEPSTSEASTGETTDVTENTSASSESAVSTTASSAATTTSATTTAATTTEATTTT